MGEGNNAHIASIKVVLSEVGWSSSPVKPNITINIVGSDDGRDIRSVTCDYDGLKAPQCLHIREEIIRAIGDNITCDTERDQHLLNKLKIVMASLSSDEVDSITSTYATLFPTTNCDVAQQVVDVFVAEIAIYVVTMELIQQDLLWEFFPFRFELPMSVIDSKILTYNMIKCVTVPFESGKIIGETMSRELSWIMVSLFNSWATIFILGEEVDESGVIHKMLNSMTAAVLSKMDQEKGELSKMYKENLDRVRAEADNKYNILVKEVEMLKVNMGFLTKSLYTVNNKVNGVIFEIEQGTREYSKSNGIVTQQ